MAKVTAIPDPVAALVDHFCLCEVNAAPVRPLINARDRAWDKIKAEIKDRPNDRPVTLTGKLYRLEIDACQPKRRVKGIAKVFEVLKAAFGVKRYYELLEFPLGPIDAMYSEDERGEVVETTQTGARKIISMSELKQPALAKAA